MNDYFAELRKDEEVAKRIGSQETIFAKAYNQALNDANPIVEKLLKEERDRVVDFIQQKFNSDEYGDMFPEDDEDWTDEQHEAGFWMWFNPILNQARHLTNKEE